MGGLGARAWEASGPRFLCSGGPDPRRVGHGCLCRLCRANRALLSSQETVPPENGLVHLGSCEGWDSCTGGFRSHPQATRWPAPRWCSVATRASFELGVFIERGPCPSRWALSVSPGWPRGHLVWSPRPARHLAVPRRNSAPHGAPLFPRGAETSRRKPPRSPRAELRGDAALRTLLTRMDSVPVRGGGRRPRGQRLGAPPLHRF